MSLGNEQIRQIIAENNISNVQDIYSYLKESFKDMLQEMLEAEMDASIGYVKNEQEERIFNKDSKEPVWRIPH